jgi:hypothetical protein
MRERIYLPVLSSKKKLSENAERGSLREGSVLIFMKTKT